MSKKNDCWAALLSNTTLDIQGHVARHGFYDLDSKVIKRLTGEEPRLMAYISDLKANPAPLTELGFYVLPRANGLYRITEANPFIRLPFLGLTPVYPLRRIDYAVLSGPLKDKNETELISVVDTSNVLSDCTGTPLKMIPIGRQRATFEYNLQDTALTANGVQVEVDGCFEGADTIHVVEAKTKGVEFISVRQVLFAKRLAEQKLSHLNKKVQAWVMVFDKKSEEFSFYKFIDDNRFYGFDQTQCRKYVLIEKENVQCASMTV